MNAAAVDGARRSRWSRAVLATLVASAGAAVWLSASSPRGPHGPPLDPQSTSPDGTKALALLVAGLGGRVDTSGILPASGTGVALVLNDNLGAPDRAGLQAWLAQGGTLVLADPTSPVLPGGLGAEPATSGQPVGPGSQLGGPGSVATRTLSGCGAPWARGVRVVEVADTPLLTGGTTSCFRADDGSFAVEQPVGKGTLVALAGPDIWTNRLLADQDNGLLAADLLVASPGSKVAWLGVTRPDVARLGSGHATLWSLLGGRIRQMLVGLAVAMGVVAAWRARRLGRPVIEAQPVAIPGSALVAAKGRLLGGGHMTEHAAQILRADLARSLGETLHLPASSSAPTLAELASWRTGRQPEEILDLLSGPLPASDAELVELARQIDALEQEIDRHEVAHA